MISGQSSSQTTATDGKVPPQIQLLFDYTKFHIGVYATLISALIALMKLGHDHFSPCLLRALDFTVLCFVVAGAAGGIIASTISLDYRPLLDNSKIGPGDRQWMSHEAWAHLEHGAFWMGIVVTVAALIFLQD